PERRGRPARGVRDDRHRDRSRGLPATDPAGGAHPGQGLAGGGVHGADRGRGGVPDREGGVMTVTTLPNIRVTQARVVASEWVKFRSLRSSYVALAATLVTMVGLGTLFAAV